MNNAKKILAKYLPYKSVDNIVNFLSSHKDLSLKITKKRQTKLGDYKQLSSYQHRISINHDLNPYQFLITLLHEIAHYLTYKKHGINTKPHGKEWKLIFSNLLKTYMSPEIFPNDVLKQLNEYINNPRASTASDGELYIILSKYDTNKNSTLKYVFELKTGDLFQLENGQNFELMEKRRTRYKCKNLRNKKIYLIHQNAQVLPINQSKKN